MCVLYNCKCAICGEIFKGGGNTLYVRRTRIFTPCKSHVRYTEKKYFLLYSKSDNSKGARLVSDLSGEYNDIFAGYARDIPDFTLT